MAARRSSGVRALGAGAVSRGPGERQVRVPAGDQPHPATTVADDLAVTPADPQTLALWNAHIARALSAARTLKAGAPSRRGGGSHRALNREERRKLKRRTAEHAENAYRQNIADWHRQQTKGPRSNDLTFIRPRAISFNA